jgi:predicted ATPase/DNA-binding winged helix-turn-helix (wHTH) protein
MMSLTSVEVEVAEQVTSPVDRVLSFDQFQILPGQRLLLEAGRSVRIGSRAFDLLVTLLERPGERVTKAELLARVWPDTHVGEGNLKFQVAALRRALRDGKDGRRFIDTSQGQGYSFVTPIHVTDRSERSALPVPVSVAAPRHNLPQQLPPLFGRTEAIARLMEPPKSRQLVTIVGAGGIGKTSVALAVAERLVGSYEDGVWVVDFARITDPNQVRSVVAGAVGIEIGPELTPPNLVAALRNKRMLLVLDNCAHVVDAAAALVSAVLECGSRLHILATSREPLRTRGEHLFRLAPLDVPPPTPRLAAAEALRFPSVQLFVDQAAASLDGFQFGDDDAPNVACICRKLDGIPLAIELAAARVGVLGISGLAAQLDDRLRILTGGRRTALPRHRTLRATLDWSYDLLSASEQTVLSRLAIFIGWFTLDAAATVASDASHSEHEVVQLVLELAAKSLVVADVDSDKPRFRLLDTTRAYALEKAKERDELEGLARRHAALWCMDPPVVLGTGPAKERTVLTSVYA